MRAETRDRGVGFAAVRVGIVEAAVLGGKKFARRHELLLRQQRRHQSRQRTAALMKLHRRRAPGGERAGGLAAGKAERPRHGVGIEFEQRADRGGRTERTDHAWAMPSPRTEFRIIEAETDPRRHLTAGRKGGEQGAAGKSIALGDGERWRHDFGRDVRERRPIHVAHGDRGDEISVEQRGARK